MKIFRKYLNDLQNLPIVLYNKEILNYNSINKFEKSSKYYNDSYNKTRENIIGAIINKKINYLYYKKSNRWNKLYNNINNFLKFLINDIIYDNIIVKQIGGRKYNYDMKFILYYKTKIIKEYNIEFKFNCNKITNLPQFVSPSKPSFFLSSSYEEYFYDKYLSYITSDLDKPEKDLYIKSINSSNPKFMLKYKDRYDNGCKRNKKFTFNKDDIEFYELCNNISKKSIIEFIKNNELDINKLSKYLIDTQKDKIYMLYYDNNFIIEKIDINDYNIISVCKNKNRYDCITSNGKKINVLLRWKNGNGIAYPAFQISSK
jgi:hypothetical protein